MPHFTAITVDRFINTGASNSVDRPNQGTRTVLKASSTNSKPWDYLRLEKRYSLPITRRKGVEKGDASTLKNTIEISSDEKASGSDSFASESSSRVWRTSSDSIISELGNGVIINECQIGCSNLENEVAVEEGKNDLRNGHIGEDGCEMSSTGSHSVASESSSHVWLSTSDSDSISSEHVNDAIINECQIGCINLENGISVDEGNDDIRNGHTGEEICEMHFTNSLDRETDSEDLCVPHDSVWLTASDSIISEHMNVAMINESQIGCINLENEISVEEGNDKVINGHIGEDVCEMPSNDSLCKESDSEGLCVPHDSIWLTASDSIISEHMNDAIIDECQIGCINLENEISVDEENDKVINGHIVEVVCEMPSTNSLGRESDSEDLCVASSSIISEHVNDAIINECQIGCINLENGISVDDENDEVINGHIGEDVCEMPSTDSLGRESDSEDLSDCNDLVSSYSSLKDEEEECGIFSSLATPTPGVEFYDACEELSFVQNSGKAALEDELVEIRLSLSIETENRNQAEKALANMQTRWERMREHLSLFGLTLPSSSSSENEETEMFSQQIQVIRFVSESIGRGIGKAEAITEMENRVEAKNFEITRLCDRLRYYEAVNREMSQRNQQVAAEGTRRLGKRRKWRQRWIWSSIGVTMSIGVVAVACKYLQTGNSSSTMHCSIEE